MTRTRLAAWGVLLALSAGQAAAQGTPQRSLAARAFDLERSGNYAGAVSAYRALLAEDPAMVPALLGLERALSALSRLPEMTKDIQAALATPGVPSSAFSVAIRVWTGAGMPDSARRVVERWAAEDPGNEAPWQEWGYAASARREFALARTALTTGRTRLGRPNALAAELAQLASIQEDYRTAVPEWIQAVEARTEQRGAAEALLGQAPAMLRPQVLALLTASGSPTGQRLAAVLTARWGDPLAGVATLEASLSVDRTSRIDELVHFQEEISGTLTPAGRRAEGRVLEALAALHTGESATRYWLDAAQAFSDGGDADAARRTLTRLAGGTGVPPEAASRATVTLVAVLVDEGRVAEADRQLNVLQGTLSVDDRERLTRQIAAGWVREGNLERAAAMMAADSSVQGLDLAGRIQVFRGDLAAGAELLRAAGPFAGTRDEASSRIRYLALLQVLAVDSSTEVGQGLLALERGDSAAAARQLDALSNRFPPLGGGAELGLLAGQLYAELGMGPDAQRALERAASSEAPAAAAAAGLELARLDGAQGRRAEAVARLEALILAWPGSAVAPEARRLIDGLRGATPGRP